MSGEPASGLRAWVVDTTAMVVFCTVTGMAVEVGLSGLTLAQSVSARLAAIPLNLLTARPYGLYRDWLWRRFGGGLGGAPVRALLDVVAFASFQVPIYATVLFLAGAEPGQIITACTSLAVLSVCMGRPYGLFLELCRRWGLPERPEPRAAEAVFPEQG